jgi:GH15 family glucan-1,4-alpha-glucosidase
VGTTFSVARVERIDGYLPLRDYALIGDGQTSALVGRDGAVDWLCVPNPDSPPVFDRLLDARDGGSFQLAPAEPFDAVRRYREGTNVVETTFTTASGTARMTDAMVVGGASQRLLVRLVDGLAGTVAMRTHFEPRYDFGRRDPAEAELELKRWGADEDAFEVRAGDRATLALSSGGPVPLSRDQIERDVERTSALWMSWSGRASYDGPWRDAVVRSALVLKLLTFAPSGAILAAPTTSLPERLGDGKNWDYRYSWLRDGIYTMRALLALGYREEAEAFFRWQMRATEPTAPEAWPLYRIDGSYCPEEEELELPGYRDSRPVRVGNAAADQLQLDNYGHLLESAARLRAHVVSLGTEVGPQLASFADFVADSWRRPDAGIWEVRDRLYDFVQSKAMCWTALDRAAKLAERGALPDRALAWRRAADEAREWIEIEGWDEERQTYRRAPGHEDITDASLLTLALCAYSDPAEPRFAATLDTVRRELAADGPLLYRTPSSRGTEGAFLACSFWLVDALGRAGRVDEGNELMAELVDLANDVGLYAEQIEPGTNEFLGNFPQGLVHLALVNAAVSLAGGPDEED